MRIYRRVSRKFSVKSQRAIYSNYAKGRVGQNIYDYKAVNSSKLIIGISW